MERFQGLLWMSVFTVAASWATAEEPALTIPVVHEIVEVALTPDQTLLGAIVDPDGMPVSGAPVAVGRAGKLFAESTTDKDGRFRFLGLTPGTYQVVSAARVQTYAIQAPEHASPHAKRGVIHVMPTQVARAAHHHAHHHRRSIIEILDDPAVFIPAVIIGGLIAAADDNDAS